jgi:hypothetical protein
MNPSALFTFVLPFIFTLASTSALPLTRDRCTPNFNNYPIIITGNLYRWGFPSAAQPAWGDTMVLKVSIPYRPEFQIVPVTTPSRSGSLLISTRFRIAFT